MGLFSKKTSSRPSSQYAPPPGPPPGQGGGYRGPSSAQPQQHYQPPSGPPPGWQQQQQQPQQQYGQHNYQPPPAAARPSRREDPLAALSRYDTFFLVDDSESMEMFWDELAQALAAVIQEAAKYDEDGVELAFFNSQVRATSKSAQDLLQLFRRVEPRRSTPSASALKRVLEPYMSDYENWQVEGKPTGFPRPKPLNLIVLTDGAPDRGEHPEDVIVDIARRLDKLKAPPFQIGIQFVQIGTDDEAADHLRALDDDLKSKHGIRDYVDTTLFDKVQGKIDSSYMLKALLGGVNRSVDKQA